MKRFGAISCLRARAAHESPREPRAGATPGGRAVVGVPFGAGGDVGATGAYPSTASVSGGRPPWASAAHSITFAGAGQRQSWAEDHHLVAEPCRRICVRDAGACLAGSIIKPMVESMELCWQRDPLSTGAIGRFLVPEPLPKSPVAAASG
jgi:hypothetical protein